MAKRKLDEKLEELEKTERQLLWYKFSENNPERHYWNFLIINEANEIEKIKQKLYDNLKPIIAEKRIYKSPVNGPGFLFSELFCLETTVCNIDFSKIYRGKVCHDRRLYPRKSLHGWDDFTDKIFIGDI